MEVTVQVTQEHIQQGRRNKCKRCPIALAINELLMSGLISVVSDGTVAVIDIAWVLIPNEESWYETLAREDTPPSAAKFIHDFDRGFEVRPFSFQLRLPDIFVSKGGV